MFQANFHPQKQAHEHFWIFWFFTWAAVEIEIGCLYLLKIANVIVATTVPQVIVGFKFVGHR